MIVNVPVPKSEKLTLSELLEADNQIQEIFGRPFLQRENVIRNSVRYWFPKITFAVNIEDGKLGNCYHAHSYDSRIRNFLDASQTLDLVEIASAIEMLVGEELNEKEIH